MVWYERNHQNCVMQFWYMRYATKKLGLLQYSDIGLAGTPSLCWQ